MSTPAAEHLSNAPERAEAVSIPASKPHKQGPRTLAATFIPACLDDAGLTPQKFRVLCRVSRCGVCYQSIETIASGCRLHPQTVRDALKFLVNAGFIERSENSGRTNFYRVAAVIPAMPTPTKGIEGSLRKKCRGTPTKGIETKVPSPMVPSRRATEAHTFKKPNVSEAKAYAAEIGLPDSEVPSFFDEYDSIGWILKGSPICDWRPLLRKWKRSYLTHKARQANASKHKGNGL